jgi:hypothetical protein
VSVTEPVAEPRRSSAKALAITTIVVSLAVGFVIGVVATHLWMFHRGPRHPRFGPFGTTSIVNRLDRDLHFTSPQREAVTRIVEARGDRIDALLGGTHDQVRREIDQANAEINKLLTPEQQAKFEKVRMRLHLRRHMPGASSPAGSPDR